MRLIDADALIEKLNVGAKGFEAVLLRLKTDEPVGYFHRLSVRATIELYEIIKGFIEKQPTVEERPRGEWINHLDLTEDYCGESKQCSLCGYKDYNTRRFSWHKFCPNRGADMRGEGE